jgi:hypothetical protein
LAVVLEKKDMPDLTSPSRYSCTRSKVGARCRNETSQSRQRKRVALAEGIAEAYRSDAILRSTRRSGGLLTPSSLKTTIRLLAKKTAIDMAGMEEHFYPLQATSTYNNLSIADMTTG